jgi:hypothetical protein
MVPSFTFSAGGGDADHNIVLRGVGTQTSSRSVDQSVGTVVDATLGVPQYGGRLR